jgi:hypothetical protein
MRRARVLAPVLVAALALPACGSDEEGNPIPQSVARAIETQLDLIQNRVDANNPGACADIEENNADGTFAEVERQVASIPSDVDADVVDALQDSVDRLKELVNDECTQISEETETTPEQTETVTIETIPEETTPTETVPTETVPEEDLEELPPGQQKKQEKLGGEGGTEPGGGTGGGGVEAPGSGE